MITNETKLIAYGFLVLSLYLTGVFTGYRIATPKPPPAITTPAAPSVTHTDGSVTLERIPSTPAKPAPKPLPKPAGTVTTHEIILTITPSDTPKEAQLDIQQATDGSERVTLKGNGITGQDFTIPRPPPLAMPRWMAGPAWDGKNYGMMVGYQWNHAALGIIGTRSSGAAFVAIRF